MTRFCLGGMLVGALIGCAEPQPGTEVLVRIEADDALEPRIARLQVRVQGGATGSDLDDRFEQELTSPELPLRVAIVPIEQDARRVFRVEALAYSSRSELLGVVRARSGYVEARTVELVLRLEACCEAVAQTCGANDTCRSCMCTDEEIDIADASVPFDAGVDAGLDAASDTALDTVMPVDAPDSAVPLDAMPPIDGDVDSGSDAGIDDAGFDVGIDSGPPPPCQRGEVLELGVMVQHGAFDLVPDGSDFLLAIRDPASAMLVVRWVAPDGTLRPTRLELPNRVGTLDATPLPDGGVAIVAAGDSVELFVVRGGVVARTVELSPFPNGYYPSVAALADGTLGVTWLEGTSPTRVIFARVASSAMTLIDLDTGAIGEPIQLVADGTQFAAAYLDGVSAKLTFASESGVLTPRNIDVLLGSLSGLHRDATGFLVVGAFGLTTVLARLDGEGSVLGVTQSLPFAMDVLNTTSMSPVVIAGNVGGVVRWGQTPTGGVEDVVWFEPMSLGGVRLDDFDRYSSTALRVTRIASLGEQWGVASVESVFGTHPLNFGARCPDL